MKRIGIMGATGMVGREIIEVLKERNYPVEKLRLFASPRNAGNVMSTPFGDITLEDSATVDYSELDIAFFAVGGSWSKENVSKATGAGCYVIDSSSAFRYDPNVPVVVPEINADAIGDSKLISKPNCTTAIAAIPLHVIHQKYGLKKVIISSYQATSGAGAAGMAELEEESKNYLQGKEVKNEAFAHPIPFNIIPHIDAFQENDYTKEEMKIVWETKKIFDDESIDISCTCVRIPTFRAHAESIVVETEKEINPEDVKELIRNTEGVELKDDIENNVYPMPLTATKKYDVEVGRIRQSLVFGKNGLEFFVCGDQILKGASLNAVQIAEVLLKRGN
ncbi:aspartate-semialdehyde dehydrogenase [archaeon D22]|nr:aspartate-semialdehyde dehydrogenase [archaeon D22]